MIRLASISLILFLLTGTYVYAETVYVTDMLRLNLYEKSKSEGKVIKTVFSGAALQVLERENGYAKVKDPEGTIGWVKSAYLVTEKPPRLVVDNLEKKLANFTVEYTRMKESLTAAQAKSDQSTRAEEQAKLLLASQTQQLGELKQANVEMRDLIDSFGSSIPLSIYIGSIIICLIIGFLGGWLWLDFRIRKQHGGFRIY